MSSWRDIQWFCLSASDGEKGIFGGPGVFDHHINREAERLFQAGFDACTEQQIDALLWLNQQVNISTMARVVES